MSKFTSPGQALRFLKLSPG